MAGTVFVSRVRIDGVEKVIGNPIGCDLLVQVPPARWGRFWFVPDCVAHLPPTTFIVITSLFFVGFAGDARQKAEAVTAAAGSLERLKFLVGAIHFALVTTIGCGFGSFARPSDLRRAPHQPALPAAGGDRTVGLALEIGGG